MNRREKVTKWVIRYQEDRRWLSGRWEAEEERDVLINFKESSEL